MGLLTRLLPRYLNEDLRRHKQSATFNRLGTSQHVADLRLIFAATLVIAFIAACVGIVFSIAFTVGWLDRDGVPGAVTIAAGIGALICSVCTWIYMTASARLGVVDLFACEIATLTRVGTIVNVAGTFAERFGMLPTDRASTAEPSAASAAHPSTSAAAAKRAACVPAIDRFSSAENYFPVFETTTKDLQQLEAAVVSNVTAFYTYMKTMRDYLRRLADLQSEQPNFEEARASTVTNIIYMLFLAYESAQRAIHELVEYEPERDECTITIYLTELQAYRFLLKRFPSNDLRHRRLLLRRDPYVAAIAELTAAVEVGDGREWDAAKETMPDLLALCREIFGADVIEKATMDARAMRALKKLEGPKRRRVAAGRVSMASS